MTVSDLIDYLEQFPPDSQVILTEDQAPEHGDFVVLE